MECEGTPSVHEPVGKNDRIDLKVGLEMLQWDRCIEPLSYPDEIPLFHHSIQKRSQGLSITGDVKQIINVEEMLLDPL